MDTASFAPNSLITRYLTIDLFRRQCTLRGEPIPLTGTEFAILSFLMENRGRVVPARELRAGGGEQYAAAAEQCERL